MRPISNSNTICQEPAFSLYILSSAHFDICKYRTLNLIHRWLWYNKKYVSLRALLSSLLVLDHATFYTLARSDSGVRKTKNSVSWSEAEEPYFLSDRKPKMVLASSSTMNGSTAVTKVPRDPIWQGQCLPWHHLDSQFKGSSGVVITERFEGGVHHAFFRRDERNACGESIRSHWNCEILGCDDLPGADMCQGL